jgi:hypothetical protein
MTVYYCACDECVGSGDSQPQYTHNQPSGHLFLDTDGDGLCDHETDFPALERRCLSGPEVHKNPTREVAQSPGSLTPGAECGGGSAQVQNAMDQAGSLKSGSGVTAGETAPDGGRAAEGKEP